MCYNIYIFLIRTFLLYLIMYRLTRATMIVHVSGAKMAQF